MDEQRTKEIINNLHGWFIERDYRGADPYQLDEKAFTFINKIHFLRSIRRILKPYHGQVPNCFFSRLTPIHHPKAIALIISANSYLYKISGDNALIDENMRLIKLLNILKNNDYKYACWGHPFEWGQSPRYPKNAPLVCVQAPIAHSLIDFYEVYQNKYILELIKSSIIYLLNEAKKDYFSDCCSFQNSPFDRMHVHNSNIMAASLFYRYNDILADEQAIDLADKLVRFTIKSQNSDGSWYYSSKIKTIDNRHTGFVLRALNQIYNLSSSKEVKKSFDMGLTFYKKELFEGIHPKWSINQTYPIDIHDVAQSIITFAEAGDIQYAYLIADFAVTYMFNGKDEFYYKIFKDGRTNKAVFIRWGQAWMMLALTTLLEAKKIE